MPTHTAGHKTQKAKNQTLPRNDNFIFNLLGRNALLTQL
ncbi:hypothetical protein NIAMH_56 [Serratia phage vB_SmaS_Niamh]|nr:hypothetical protein NIAMH_56 [Serratia phage vB_SmaS_Niamh]